MSGPLGPLPPSRISMPLLQDLRLRLVLALMFASLLELPFVRFKWTGSTLDLPASLARIRGIATDFDIREESFSVFSSKFELHFRPVVPLLALQRYTLFPSQNRTIRSRTCSDQVLHSPKRTPRGSFRLKNRCGAITLLWNITDDGGSFDDQGVAAGVQAADDNDDSKQWREGSNCNL